MNGGGETLALRLRRERMLAPAAAASLLRRSVAALERADRPHPSLIPADLVLVPPDEVELRPAPEPRDDAPYRPPEEEASARADVYALACIFYQMLVGVPPFPGPDASDFVEQHRFAPPPRPGRARVELARFDALVRRALAKQPAERFQSLAELAAAIPPDPPVAARPSRRWIGAALLVTLAAGGTAVLLWSAPPAPSPTILPDAAPARRLLEPVVTIGPCRGDDHAPPAPRGELRPFPSDELAREQRRVGVPGFLRQHRPELARCYRAALARVPPVAGLVWLRLALRDDGTVASAAATGLGDPAVEACLAVAARQVRFAIPATGSVELRCPVALAYAGTLPADASAVRIEDDRAPPALAPGDVPARRGDDGWEALGVIIAGEPGSLSVAVGPGEDLVARFGSLRTEFADDYAIELVPAAGVRWGRAAEAMVAARDAGFPAIRVAPASR